MWCYCSRESVYVAVIITAATLVSPDTHLRFRATLYTFADMPLAYLIGLHCELLPIIWYTGYS